MSITHEEAHELIQLKMEDLLDSREHAKLSAHLRDCSECKAYAIEMNEVTNLLLPIMKRQWSVQPVPLSIASLVGRRGKTRTSTVLTMRTAAVGVLLVALFFSAWQFVLSGPAASSRLPLQAPPVPTPSWQSAQSTSTIIHFQDCQMVIYSVQKTDTLLSIARQFSVSKDTIMEVNGLQTDIVSPSMELLIPACHLTPTSTFRPATFTTTFTPLINFTTASPGG